jgi:hypothetical protein
MEHQSTLNLLVVLKHLAQLDLKANLLTRTDEDENCARRGEWFICSKCVLKYGNEEVFKDLKAVGADVDIETDRICSFCPFGSFFIDIDKTIDDTINVIQTWKLLE